MQLVEIIKVIEKTLKVMFPSRQPIKGIKTMQDVMNAEFADEAMVM